MAEQPAAEARPQANDLVAELREFRNDWKRQNQATMAIPPYSFKTSFLEWGSHFARLTQGRLGLSDTEMIELATKSLDGFVGTIAIAAKKKHPTDWRAFVSLVDKYLSSKSTIPPTYNNIRLRQCDADDEDFCSHAFMKHIAITEEWPNATQGEILKMLTSGLNPENYKKLNEKVKADEITTFEQFIDAGIEIKNKMYHPASDRLGSNQYYQKKNLRYNNNYYAQRNPNYRRNEERAGESSAQKDPEQQDKTKPQNAPWANALLKNRKRATGPTIETGKTAISQENRKRLRKPRLRAHSHRRLNQRLNRVESNIPSWPDQINH